MLAQATEEPKVKVAMLDLVLMNKEELLRYLNVRGSLGCSEHKVVESRILREEVRRKSRIRARHFNLFRGYGPGQQNDPRRVG